MSNFDFSKFDKNVNLEGLKNDIKAVEENGGNGDFDEVPLGTYEVKITKLELKASKKGDPMVTCWMKILAGDHKGQLLFMNQVITRDFQFHIVNKFLRSLASGIDVQFDSYNQYGHLLMDIAEAIDGKKEYAVVYGENKGFSTFEITEVYELTEE